MDSLPSIALSVRQPWAWAIVYAFKDVENRCWRARNPGLRQRGRVAIHASKGMTRGEYEEARSVIEQIGHVCPSPAELLRGGIIGSVEIVDVITTSDSPWFFGPRGLVLVDSRPHAFIPAVGALGFFQWRRADASIVPQPAKWMLSNPAPIEPSFESASRDPDLFDQMPPAGWTP